MELTEVLAKRKSVRTYTGQPVSTEELNAILAAAQAAPVAMGSFEKVHLTVVTNPALLKKISEAGAAAFGRPGTDVLYGAPTLVVVSAQIATTALENPMYSSAAMIVHDMALAATSLGVGSCDIWGAIAAIVQDTEVVEALQIPMGFTPCCAVALGKTDEAFPTRDVPADKIETNVIE